MISDIEQLRQELKTKIDEVLDSYLINNNTKELVEEDDNALISIPEDNIYMEFEIGEQSYIAFSENSEDEEEIDMMFAKVDMIDGMKIIRNIEDEAEYERVIKEYETRLNFVIREEEIYNV